jgi:hypothetical protein
MFRFLILVALVGGLGYWYWTTTPEYAIEQVRNSVRDHDLVKFQKYADTDAIASNIVDDFLEKPMQEVLGAGLLGRFLTAGLVGMFKQEMVTGTKEQVVRFVETGDFVDKSKSVDSGVAPTPLEQVDKRLGFRNHAFKEIESVHKDGKIATVDILVHNQVYNKDLKVELKMNDMGGYWRLTELSNFPEITAKIVEWEVDAAKQNADGQPVKTEKI